jgi:hypothetical protein
MIARTLAFLLAAGLLSGSCLAVELGVVQLNTESGSYLYAPQALAPDSKVYFQFQTREGNTRCCLAMPSKSFVSVQPDDNASDAITGKPAHRYKLVGKNGRLGDDPSIGIAVIGNAPLRVKQTRPTALDITTPGSALVRALSCTSAEGVHITGRNGSQLVSDLYLGLGYELEEATCRDEDLK